MNVEQNHFLLQNLGELKSYRLNWDCDTGWWHWRNIERQLAQYQEKVSILFFNSRGVQILLFFWLTFGGWKRYSTKTGKWKGKKRAIFCCKKFRREVRSLKKMCLLKETGHKREVCKSRYILFSHENVSLIHLESFAFVAFTRRLDKDRRGVLFFCNHQHDKSDAVKSDYYQNNGKTHNYRRTLSCSFYF